MAARDIMPWSSPRGGTYEVRWATMTAGELFEVGEPIAIVDTGTATEPPDDTSEILISDLDSGRIIGIAAAGPGAGNINPATGVAYATGDEVPYWPAGQGTLFKTSNFFAAAAASAVVPALTDIGESYQISYGTFGTPDAGWGIEQTAGATGTDVCAVVIDVLDVRNDPIRLSGGTGTQLVFEIKTSL